MIKKANKIIASLLLALSLISVFPLTSASAETQAEKNAEYRNFLKNECEETDVPAVYIRKSDGKYFGESTNAAYDSLLPANQLIYSSYFIYYAESDGSLVKNKWIYANRLKTPHFYWYYFGSDYKAITKQYKIIDGKKYYFNKEGILSIGWKRRSVDDDITANYKDKKWYYFGEDGTIKEGWVQSGGKWYYVYSDGLMATDTTTPDGYYVNKSGVCVS